MSNPSRAAAIDSPPPVVEPAPRRRSANGSTGTAGRRFALRFGCAAVLAFGALAAQADRSVYQLRYFELETSRWFRADGEDVFANGDPSTGIVYSTPSGSVAGGWNPGTGSFGPGAELSGPAADFAGRQYGLGSLAFRYGDAAKATNNLTPPGFDAYALSQVPNFNFEPSWPGLGLVAKDGGFGVYSAWDFQALKPGESVVLGISGTGQPNYVDRLALRFGARQDNGQLYIAFQQDTRSGFPDAPIISRTTLGSTTPSAIYPALADVDYIGLAFDRESPTLANPNPSVRATVEFLDALVNPNDPEEGAKILASFTFGNQGTTFLAGDASAVYVAGVWLTPVPEPGTAALWLVGLAGLGFVVRRRSA